MKGFLYKDVCIYRTMWKSYAVLIGIFFALTLFGIYDMSFIGTFVPILLCMGASTSLSMDEQAKWDRFAVSVPNGRVRVVRDKYRFLLLCAGLSAAVWAVLLGIHLLRGEEEMVENAALFAGSLMGILLVSAVSLPLSFRFGYHKARAITIGVTGLLAGGLGALAVVTILSFRGGDERVFLFVGALAAVTAVALPVSYKLSVKIYGKKEF